MSQVYEGGCMCGAVRFRARGPAFHLCYCHCRSCRRASGAPLLAWVTFEMRHLAWTNGAPALRASSPPVVRGFCASCGTALSYAHQKRADHIDITLAALDDPGVLSPECHIWTSERLPWVVLNDGLPQYPEWRVPE
jgi:hypothetical protein